MSPAAAVVSAPAALIWAPSHLRRRPEDSVLYQAVERHLSAFLDFARERSGHPLPRYVEQAFRKYLDCGRLDRGFLRVFCDRCQHEFLLAFSCKSRGPCPSCATRRMTDLAAQLLDRALPDVAFRQWVLTVPHELRLLLARRADVLSQVLRVFVDEVQRSYLVSAATDVPAAGETRAGAVTFVQRFSGNLGLHVHYHCVVADGVWVRAPGEGRPVFQAAPPPPHDVIERVAANTANRVLRWLGRRGLVDTRPVEDRSNEAHEDDPMTACLRAAAAQGTFVTLLEPAGSSASDGDGTHDCDAHADPKRASASRWAAQVDHFNVHAGTAVAQGRRDALERLLRYGARPVLALDRLSRLPDGRYAYRMRYPVRGRTHRLMSPMELMARLAAVVAPPRFPLLRYSGVFAPAAPWRRLVVPGRPTNRTRCCAAHDDPREPPAADEPAPPPATQAQSVLSSPPERDSSPTTISRCGPEPPAGTAATSTPPALASLPREGGTRIDWAHLLRHGLGIEAMRCPRCSATMRPIATVTEPSEVRRMLLHLGEPLRGDVPTRAWDPVPCDWDEPAPPNDWP